MKVLQDYHYVAGSPSIGLKERAKRLKGWAKAVTYAHGWV